MTEAKTMKFELGRAGDTPLLCDLDVLLRSHLVVQANSGGGKSWCLRRILEQTQGHVQQLVLDPEGEFSSLRQEFDYVVAARQGGDTAADPRTAGALAEFLLEVKVSAILDLYELEPHERILFVRNFVAALVQAPKRLWHSTMVVLDEAHVFCPQNGRAASSDAVEALVSRGRKRGFGVILATQRLSKLNKDAADVNNRLIGRTGLDVDVHRGADELGFIGRRKQRLRELEPGEFFAHGPALASSVTCVKVGPVSTSHPTAGARRSFSAPPPSATILALLPQLVDLPTEAQAQDAGDELRRENAALRRDLAAAEARVHASLKGRLDAFLKQIAVASHAFEAEVAGVSSTAPHSPRELRLDAPERPLDAAATASPRRRDRAVPPAPKPVSSPRPTPPTATKRQGGAPEKIPGPQQRILDVLAWLEPVRPQVEKVVLALLSSSSPRSSTFHNNVSALRTGGLVDYPTPGSVTLSDAGRARAVAAGPLPTSAALQAQVLQRLPGPQGRILRVLLAAFPRTLSKPELAVQVEASANSSTFHNNVSGLRTLGLIDYPRPGTTQATPVLFIDAT